MADPKFSIKKPDPAYLEQLRKSAAETAVMTAAINRRYPGGPAQMREEIRAQLAHHEQERPQPERDA